MRRSRPAGKSLLEVVVMISLMSIVLGLSATSLASLFRLRYTITRDTEHARSIDRLAMRLRQDAHEAISASHRRRLRFDVQRRQVDSLFVRDAAHRARGPRRGAGRRENRASRFILRAAPLPL